MNEILQALNKHRDDMKEHQTQATDMLNYFYEDDYEIECRLSYQFFDDNNLFQEELSHVDVSLEKADSGVWKKFAEKNRKLNKDGAVIKSFHVVFPDESELCFSAEVLENL